MSADTTNYAGKDVSVVFIGGPWDGKTDRLPAPLDEVRTVKGEQIVSGVVYIDAVYKLSPETLTPRAYMYCKDIGEELKAVVSP